MNILHVMQREKFTAPVSEFYDVHFRGGEHEICYLNTSGKESLINPNYNISQREIYLSGNLMNDVKLLKKKLCDKKYDYIVAHSLLLPPAFKVYMASPRLLKKMVWIEWGADLYTWKPAGSGIKSFVRKRLEYILRTRLHTTVCIFPPDCEYYAKEFPKSKAKVYYAPYSAASSQFDDFKYKRSSNLSAKAGTDEPIYIQIGHSATQMVNHIEVIDSLKKFADKNIRVFLPLNYGNMDYADKVQSYAEQVFPGKVICLREMMSRDEYFELVEKIDVAVFNTYRQIALGNIVRMISKNVKIYMPESSVMYQHFVSNGIPIQKFEDIAKCNFDDLRAEVLPESIDQFENYFAEYYRTEKRVARWVTVYDDLRKDLEKNKEEM